jgi:arabinogalactan oligomer/maltooligosaccharide transport system permease protein
MSAAIGILIFIMIAGISIWSFRRSKSFKEEDMLS